MMLAGYLRTIDYAGPSSVRTRQAYSHLTKALVSDGQTVAKAYGCGGWEACNESNPYDGIEEMRIAAFEARHYSKKFQVSDENHNGAFLGDHAANLLFRAHHDAAHCLARLGFGFDDECLTARFQLERLCLTIDGWSTLDNDAAAVLIGEVIGQGLYYREHDRFPLTKWGTQPTFNVTDESVYWAQQTLDLYTEGF